MRYMCLDGEERELIKGETVSFKDVKVGQVIQFGEACTYIKINQDSYENVFRLSRYASTNSPALVVRGWDATIPVILCTTFEARLLSESA